MFSSIERRDEAERKEEITEKTTPKGVMKQREPKKKRCGKGEKEEGIL